MQSSDYFAGGGWNLFMKAQWAPLLKSVLTSFVSFLADYGLLYALTEWVGLYYLLSAALSFSLANTLNFFLCARWVFPGRGRRLGQWGAFLLVGAVGLALNVGLMALFTDCLGLYYMLSKVLAASLVFFWNYAMRKRAVFRA